MNANLTSFLILALFLWGRTLAHKNIRLHIAVMLTCLVADLILVLALVLMKDALSQVSLGMHWTLKIHIPIAVATVIMYFFTAAAGFRLYIGFESARPWLRRFDRMLLTLRILTLITSLMVTAIRP
jgi:hypothetical protein